MTATSSQTEIEALRHRTVDDVKAHLARSPYQGYAYSYPHKSAYRPLAPPRTLADVWAAEPRDAIGLYVHVPFCEMRCGFCNLFTTANPKGNIVDAYLGAFQRQLISVGSDVGRFAPQSLTIGGGTPTYLSAVELARLFDVIAASFDFDPDTPVAVETSPTTATEDRLDVLVERGTNRISIGVQSFIEAETRALGRPQTIDVVAAALDRIRSRSLPCLNIDLIYGIPGQTLESWKQSVKSALQWRPDELFLYPLYVRQLTGLDGRADVHDEQRLMLYRAGRDLLLAEGYVQSSMRMFKKPSPAENSLSFSLGSPDGEAGLRDASLLGIGCGARSRTKTLHYSTDYAVGRHGVRRIIDGYCMSTSKEFSEVGYGFTLSVNERIRRAIIRSIVTAEGLDFVSFKAEFGLAAADALPELAHLVELGMLIASRDRLAPTMHGLEHADAIGPLLYSSDIVGDMEGFELQ